MPMPSEEQTRQNQLLSYAGDTTVTDRTLSDEKSPLNSHTTQLDSLHILRRKYPRLCAPLHFNNKYFTEPLEKKSDLWICRFAEECYDYATYSYSKYCESNANITSRSRNALALVEPFPELVFRFISNKYSSMALRTRLIAEILLTIDSLVSTTFYEALELYESKYRGNPASKIKIHGERMFIFANLLSESWDDPTLHLFLHVRQSAQDLLALRFKNLTVVSIWQIPGDNTGVAETLRRSQSVNDVTMRRSITRKKVNKHNRDVRVVPLQLPSYLSFIDDIGLPEAPLIAIDGPRLELLLRSLSIVSESATQLVYSRLHAKLYRQYQRSEQRHFSSDSLVEPDDFIGFGSAEAVFFPLSTVFLVLSELWYLLSLETKRKASMREDIVLSVNELNLIYDDDCKMLKDCREAVFLYEKLVAAHDAEIVKAEQQVRRLERLWDDGLESINESNLLRQTRVRITVLTIERLGLRSDLLSKRKSLEDVQSRTERLWQQVMGSARDSSMSVTSAHPKKMIGLSDVWRSDADRTLALAITSWCESALVDSRLSALVIANEDEELASLSLSVTRPRTSERTHSPEIMQSRLRSLEREVRELSSMAAPIIAELGMATIEEFPPRILSLSTGFDLRAELEELNAKAASKAAAPLVSHVIAAAYTKVLRVLTAERASQTELLLQMKLSNIAYLFDCIVHELLEQIATDVLADDLIEKRVDVLSADTVDAATTSISADCIIEALATLISKRLSAGMVLWRNLRSRLYTQRLVSYMNNQTGVFHIAAAHCRKVQLSRAVESLAVSAGLKRAYLAAHTMFSRLRLQHVLSIWKESFRRQFLARELENVIQTQKELRLQLEKNKRIIFCVSQIQRLFRGFLIRREGRQQMCASRIVYWCRRYLARKYSLRKRAFARLLHEKSNAVLQRAILSTLRFSFKVFRHELAKANAISSVFRIVQHTVCKIRFSKWKKISLILTEIRRVRNQAAVKIQSLFRMLIAQSRSMKFCLWRCRLIKSQALARRWLVYRHFKVYIRLHRSAKILQKRCRGMLVRMHMETNMISAVHNAAKGNNYDRLKYYAKIFPKYIAAVNKDGDTIMHSAAAGAAKRSIKFLLKLGVDPNVYNTIGYTPLHSLIQSPSVNRDECFDYLMDHGFDDSILGPDGKTSLLIAVEYGRAYIVLALLGYGQDPNIADTNGITCLQLACSYGYRAIVDQLLEYNADPNSPGQSGYYPLHFIMDASERNEIFDSLLCYNVNVNLPNESNFEYPLMTACLKGVEEMVGRLLSQGALIDGVDMNGWTAAHYAASSLICQVELYRHLLGADASFESKDQSGNTPIHIACLYGNSEYSRCLLHGGVSPAVQNNEGDYPSHIAARYNYTDCLRLICAYEVDIGRVNFQKQTPVGCAQFYGSTEALLYLQSLYDKLPSGTEANGATDTSITNWLVAYDDHGGRTFVNTITDERTNEPPTVASVSSLLEGAAIVTPYQKRAFKIVEKKTITKNEYMKEVANDRQSLIGTVKAMSAAALIQRRIRTMLLRRRRKRELDLLRAKNIMCRFILPRIVEKMRQRREKRIILVQSHWRGHHFRLWFYYTSGEYARLWYLAKEKYLARMIYRSWKLYRMNRLVNKVSEIKHIPSSFLQWQALLSKARLVRTVGLIEEYIVASMFIYRQIVSGVCTFEKPLEIVAMDQRHHKDSTMMEVFGYTESQINLVIRLQTLARGRLVRIRNVKTKKAYLIADTSLENYLKHPDLDQNVFNYALYCHIVLNDTTRARSMYIDSIRRMESRGPDISFVLYSYSIFAYVYHESDFSEVFACIARGKEAEILHELSRLRRIGIVETETTIRSKIRFGKSYDLAMTGFIKRYAEMYDTCESWHHYGACMFLVYDDFNSCFKAFVRAFEKNGLDQRLRANFEYMMTHYFGDDAIGKEQFMSDYMRDATGKQLKIHKLG